jgi:hypothetical protein
LCIALNTVPSSVGTSSGIGSNKVDLLSSRRIDARYLSSSLFLR